MTHGIRSKTQFFKGNAHSVRVSRRTCFIFYMFILLLSHPPPQFIDSQVVVVVNISLSASNVAISLVIIRGVRHVKKGDSHSVRLPQHDKGHQFQWRREEQRRHKWRQKSWPLVIAGSSWRISSSCTIRVLQSKLPSVEYVPISCFFQMFTLNSAKSQDCPLAPYDLTDF